MTLRERSPLRDVLGCFGTSANIASRVRRPLGGKYRSYGTGCSRVLAPKELLEECGVTLRLEMDSPSTPSPAARAPTTFEGSNVGGKVPFDYGGRELVPGDRTERILDAKSWSILRRNFERERSQLEVFRVLGLEIEEQLGRVEIPAERFAEAVRTGTEAGVCVLASAHRVVTPKRVAARIRGLGVDWFDLEMDVDFGSEAPGLPTLLAAVKRGERRVTPKSHVTPRRSIRDAATSRPRNSMC